MKATELRIGNLLYGINRRSEVHLPATLPLKILQIGIFNSEALPFDKNPAEEENWLKITNSDLSPIPLTEDWLKRLGCQASKNNEGVYFLNHLGWCCEFDGEDWAVRQKFEDESIVAYCRYVHQLQNLYFALTGEELTILSNYEILR